MVINLGAYATEIVRAGIKAVPAGQLEAGTALGLSSRQLFRSRRVAAGAPRDLSRLGSQFILIMLASSVVSVISAEELTAVADTLVARHFRSSRSIWVVHRDVPCHCVSRSRPPSRRSIARSSRRWRAA